MKHEQNGFLCKPFISLFLGEIVTFNAAIYSRINLRVVYSYTEIHSPCFMNEADWFLWQGEEK